MKKLYLILYIFFGHCVAKYVSNVDDTMSYYTYKGERLTQKNLYKLAPKPSKQKQNEIKEWIQKNSNDFDIKKLLNNPPNWTNTGTLDILNNRLIEHIFKNKMENSNYVFKVEELGLIFKISSFENRIWNIIRGEWGDSGFYDYKYGKLSLDKISTLPATKKTYQTASRIAYYLILKEALEKNHIKSIALPDLFIFTLDETDNICDSNTIVVEPIIELGELLIDYIKKNKVSDELIKEFATIIVDANLWNLKQVLFIKDDKVSILNKQLRLFDLEQPNKTRPQDAFITQHSDFALGRDIEWNVISGLHAFYEILKNGKHDEYKVFQDWMVNGPKKDFIKKLNGSKYLFEVTGISEKINTK